jgi:hypothetical protein
LEVSPGTLVEITSWIRVIIEKLVVARLIKNLGLEVLTAVVMKSFIFWSITLCSPLKANPATYFMLVSCLAYYSTLKIEAKWSSESSIGVQ